MRRFLALCSPTLTRAALGALAAACLLAPAAEAATGEKAQRRFLDPKFGARGKVELLPRRGIFSGADVVKQSDGRLVVAGSYSRAAKSGLLIARFERNGARDRSFGGNGRVKLPLESGSSTVGTGVALAANGRIVATGRSGDRIATVRLRPDGTPDRSFGGNGRVRTSFPGASVGGQSVAVEPGGDAVIVLGSVTEGDAVSVALVRYLSDGSLDPAFGSGGRVSTGFGVPGEDLAVGNAVLLQPDGRIVAAGALNNPFGGGGAFALARYESDGSLDPSFGATGKVATMVGNEGGGVDMYRDGAGRLVVAGVKAVPSGQGLGSFFTVIRYLADGTLDPSWGSAGIATTGFRNSDGPFASAIAPLAGGRVFVAGPVDTPTSATQFGLVTYGPDGSRFTGFGIGGRARTRFGSDMPDDVPGGIAVQAGKPVVAGASARGAALARYRRP
jgi:uncharacterized delta-60 repeat protein